MEFRHSLIHNLFKQLDDKVNLYLKTKADACLEENSEDANAFYECMNTNTSELRDNYYKFENLSLYSDLREKECNRDSSEYTQCINTLVSDLTGAMNDLTSNLE